jgi:hypothetical protein
MVPTRCGNERAEHRLESISDTVGSRIVSESRYAGMLVSAVRDLIHQ